MVFGEGVMANSDSLTMEIIFQLLDGATTAVLFGFFLYIWYKRSVLLAENQAEQMKYLADTLNRCMDKIGNLT